MQLRPPEDVKCWLRLLRGVDRFWGCRLTSLQDDPKTLPNEVITAKAGSGKPEAPG